MSSPLDLTSLPAVKAWLNIPTTGSDALLATLITAASRLIYSNLGRASLLPRSFTERYDGAGTKRMYLRNWPVLSISSMSVYGRNVPLGEPPGQNSAMAGFVIDPWDGTPPGQPQAIDVFGDFLYAGFQYSRGRQDVAITYAAGYQVTAEPWTVPASPYMVTPLAPYGPFASDQGVTYAATGIALTPTTGTPAKGQYVVANGAYTFAAADAGAAVLINYGFIPADVSQVATELVGERFVYRDRIGVNSKSLGGQETISYAQQAMSKTQNLMLQPYRAVMIPGV
jgi:hypothetical protein